MGILSGIGYAARVAGFSHSTNWFPFKKSLGLAQGWHRFEARLTTTNAIVRLDLKSDGQVDFTTRIPFNKPPGEFTQLRFGGLASRPSRGGPVLVDNIQLQVVEIDEPVLASSNPKELPPGAASRPPPNLNSAITDYPAVAWWILSALLVIIGLLAGLLFLLKRSWPVNVKALLPFSHPGTSESTVPALSDGDSEKWRQRAVAAEALAVQQAQMMGGKVAPELAQFAKQALVQGLYTQRNALMETQRKAQEALEELEARLAELQLPVPDRIQAYEKRIAELEKELQTRGDEMRELTHATLLLIRQKLEQERERTPRLN